MIIEVKKLNIQNGIARPNTRSTGGFNFDFGQLHFRITYDTVSQIFTVANRPPFELMNDSFCMPLSSINYFIPAEPISEAQVPKKKDKDNG